MTEPDRFLADLARVASGTPRPLLLAVSGGPDSMAMLVLAADALPGGIAVATVDHGLRAEAADEAAMVAAACASLHVPHATLTGTTPPGASLQAQARALRYALLADHARDIGAEAIATAHHADDQAETFLMRAARGVGLSGLAGIRAVTTIEGARVVRPLLDWRRAELRAIVRRAELPFVDDPANGDDRHDRTRFRRLIDGNEWLDPPRLARSAAALAEADAELNAVAGWLWDARASSPEHGVVALDVAGLPRGLLRILARRAITAVRDEAGMVAPHWSDGVNVEPLLDALAQGRRATQAGVVAGMRRGRWRFRQAPARRSVA
jgi:tRNA(Ile)-lysidine synthase